MSVLQEFKDFALKGNVLDLAVGVIIGAAFSKIVTSLVEDILMPPLGMAMGKVDFSSLFLSLNGQHYPSVAAAKAAGAPTINYGLFLNNILGFVIVALCVFLLVKAVNRKKRPAVPHKSCPFCRSSIDLQAIRCPQCTSDLSDTTDAVAPSQQTVLTNQSRLQG